MPEPDAAEIPDTLASCVFCALRTSNLVVTRNELAFALRDKTPVTDLHTLVLPFRHAPTYFDLRPDEWSPSTTSCGACAIKFLPPIHRSRDLTSAPTSAWRPGRRSFIATFT